MSPRPHPHTLCHSQEGTLSFVRCRSEAIIDRTGRASNGRDNLKEGYTLARRCRSKLPATTISSQLRLQAMPRTSRQLRVLLRSHRPSPHQCPNYRARDRQSRRQSPHHARHDRSRPGGAISRKLFAKTMRVERRWRPGLFGVVSIHCPRTTGSAEARGSVSIRRNRRVCPDSRFRCLCRLFSAGDPDDCA